MPRAARIRGLLGVAAVLAFVAPAQAVAVVSPVDTLLASCPTALEVASIDGDLAITFEADPTGPALVCSAGSGSANLTRLQERTYQALRVMKTMTFERPLPWTSLGLYDWLVGAIDGIRFRGDIEFSFCCSPAGVINISSAVTPGETRWIEPSGSGSLYGLVKLFVHEARHNESKPHTCGSDDHTIAELGAYGVTWYLDVWEALYSGSFLDAGDFPYAEYYRQIALELGEALSEQFCSLPQADLSVSVADAPDPVAEGGVVTYTYTVANAGPATAPEVYLYADVPTGARFLVARPSQGSCHAGPPAAPVVAGCALGTLAVGASALVEIDFRVTGSAGFRLSSAGVTAFVLGASVDADDADDSDREVTSIASGGDPRCAGRPGPGGRVIVGTSRAETLRGTPGADVICGLGGNDRLRGLGGDDTLRGGPGRDRLEGGPGRDRCLAGPPGFGSGDRRISCEA